MLTSEAVQDVVHSMLYDVAPADVNEAVKVLGVTRNFGFDPAKIEEAKPKVSALLHELSNDFFPGEGNGGGGSFLNLCNDKNGRQWTDYHGVMESLCVIAFATGQGRFLLPREAWAGLPGGMPYVVFTPLFPAP